MNKTELTTGTPVFGALDVGSSMESYSSDGKRQALRVVGITSRTTVTIRSWRWYDWLRWRSVKRAIVVGYRWLKAAVKGKN